MSFPFARNLTETGHTNRSTRNMCGISFIVLAFASPEVWRFGRSISKKFFHFLFSFSTVLSNAASIVLVLQYTIVKQYTIYSVWENQLCVVFYFSILEYL